MIDGTSGKVEEDCARLFPDIIGNGVCDSGVGTVGGVDVLFNSATCQYDGGDCCAETCEGELCGTLGYHCRDVTVFPSCPMLSDPDRLGNGICDPSPYSSAACGYDSGVSCSLGGGREDGIAY